MATESQSIILYQELANAIETMPTFGAALGRDEHLWIGRAYALIEQALGGFSVDLITFRSATDNYSAFDWERNAEKIRSCVYRAFAVAERRVPTGMSGSIVPVKSSFEALTTVARVVDQAKEGVLIVDPYMDVKFLASYARAVPEGVRIRLLADSAPRKRKASLKPAVEAWQAEFAGKRPLEARLSPADELHDRWIFVDGASAWLISQSFNALADRSPAVIKNIVPDGADAIASFEAIWTRSQTLQ